MKRVFILGIMIILMSSIAAADLSQYPEMFMKGNRLNLYIVVGKSASAEDVVGSIDIAASLMQYSQQDNYESVARLDEEILDEVYDYNLILVGGPCANAATAKVMDYPSNCNKGFEYGKAKLKLYNHGDYNALVVAGRTALDTRRATHVLADYNNPNYNFEGSELEIEGIGSTMTDVTVSSQ